MIVEQILLAIADVLIAFLHLLPSVPTEVSQMDAIFYAFKSINKIIDLPFVMVTVFAVINMSFSIWMIKLAADTTYKLWKAVKW